MTQEELQKKYDRLVDRVRRMRGLQLNISIQTQKKIIKKKKSQVEAQWVGEIISGQFRPL